MILNVEIVISNSGELSKSDSLADRANPHPSRLPAAEVDGEGSGNTFNILVLARL